MIVLDTQSEMDFGGMSGLCADFLENVELLAVNSGDENWGFAICTACGYAEEEKVAEGQGAVDLPSAYTRHVPLFRSAGAPCAGRPARHRRCGTSSSRLASSPTWSALTSPPSPGWTRSP